MEWLVLQYHIPYFYIHLSYLVTIHYPVSIAPEYLLPQFVSGRRNMLAQWRVSSFL